jgi:hypothetical protein
MLCCPVCILYGSAKYREREQLLLTTDAHPEFFLGGGTHTDATYNLCFILQTIL